MNRAEYSLQHASIVIALALGGVTLAGVGIVRLRSLAFHTGHRPMPRQVAVASLFAGIAVTAFGIALLFVDTDGSTHGSVDAPPAPLATLAPAATDQGDPSDRRSDISGRVLSIRERGVADVRVELVAVAEGDDSEPRSTTTDAGGRFVFRDADIHLGSPRIVEAVFDDARFPSEVIRAPRGSDPTVDITVAPATGSDDGLIVDVESLAVVGDETGLQAVHTLSIRNPTRRAFVGKLDLPLLRGAANIQEGGFLDRRYLVLGHGGMTSTKPILPGTTEISYTYVTPMERSGIAYTRAPQLPTRRYELLVSGKLDAEPAGGLEAAGEVDLDRTYERLSATGLRARAPVGARIVIDEGPGIVRIVAPAGAALFAALLIAFGIWRRRRRPDESDPQPAVESASLH